MNFDLSSNESPPTTPFTTTTANVTTVSAVATKSCTSIPLNWLLWSLVWLLQASPRTATTSCSGSHHRAAFVVAAAIISPRQGVNRQHRQHQFEMEQQQGFPKTLTSPCSTASTTNTKLFYKKSFWKDPTPPRTTSTSSNGLVSSIKNPISSWWRKLRRVQGTISPFLPLLSAATQEQRNFAAIDNLLNDEYDDDDHHDNNNNKLEKETSNPQESVHLQLSNTAESEEQPELHPGMDAKKKESIVHQLTFQDPTSNVTWMALNTCQRKFQAFLEYQGVRASAIHPSKIASSKIPMNRGDDKEKRREWRTLWKERRLLTDRTEFLAVYQSDQTATVNQTNSTGSAKGSSTSLSKHNNNNQSPKRRGGFADLLYLYSERLVGILQDEKEDDGCDGVLGWLYEHYGTEKTRQLTYKHFKTLTEQEQLDNLQQFSEWFRHLMPYYYDKCGTCSASFKDETSSQPQTSSSDNSGSDDGPKESTETEDIADDLGTFLGYIYPSDDELRGKASRTELYQCHKCKAFTRFPRFNSAHAIIDSKRGRCGEYSTLIYRFLRSLHLEARWVVDWADHVWAEVRLEGSEGKKNRWVHLDPCEAAVDKPLLYQEWGKKQTFIIALYAPKEVNGTLVAPLVEDVTDSYTTDTWHEIQQRREESREEVDVAIRNAIQDLKAKFQQGI